MGRSGEMTAASNRTASEYDLPFENCMRHNGILMPNAVPGGQPRPRDIELIRALMQR